LAAQEALREQQKKDGTYQVQTGVSNTTSAFKRQGREDAVAAQIQVFRVMLPTWLKQLSTLNDPRQAKKVKHKLAVVLLFGLLSFVFQMSSRRQANAQMSKPCFRETLQNLFPELESMPHADTLNRVLEKLDADALPSAHLALIKSFIRSNKFSKYLIQNSYPIAIDGTQKLVRDGYWWPDEWLGRSGEAGGTAWEQQYVYVLEANLVFHNGMTLPLFSEFLSHAEGDPDDAKQDCELKAFKRLAAKIKQEFPRLPILILLDGLYPNGPVFDLCLQHDWDYMIVLKDKCLSSVWEEFNALKNPDQAPYKRNWRGRQQKISWVNAISYAFKGIDGKQKVLDVHVVVCDEEWQEVNADTAEIQTKNSRHAWISGQQLTAQNVHERCNLGARFRWGIEDSNHTEKRRGYCYEHLFSHNWQAMCGFHHLMRLAHLIHAITFATRRVAKLVRKVGLREFLTFVKETLTGPWLYKNWVAQLLVEPFQWQLE
jgi:hypothetical protein